MSLPFLAVGLLSVLVISYVPPLTTWPQRFQEPETGPTIEEIWEQEVRRSADPGPASTPPVGQPPLQPGQLTLPQGVDLMQELQGEVGGAGEVDGAQGAAPAPTQPGQLTLPQGVDLMQELQQEVSGPTPAPSQPTETTP
jgi:hypothetical protein